MDKNELVFKHSSLETAQNVGETLSWEVESLREQNLPIDTSLADYIAFSVDNLDSQLSQLKAVKAEIAQREKDLKSQIEHIKVDGAIFLTDNGLDRLNGVICSSVTVSEGKEAKTTETEVKELVINISEAEVEELLIGIGKAEFVTKTIEKTSNAIPSKLKINRRKVIVPEVE